MNVMRNGVQAREQRERSERSFGAASTDCGLRHARLRLRPSPPRLAKNM
jgi:hypothetical protein